MVRQRARCRPLDLAATKSSRAAAHIAKPINYSGFSAGSDNTRKHELLHRE